MSFHTDPDDLPDDEVQEFWRTHPPSPPLSEDRMVRLREIADRIAAMPVLDTRSDEEIIGYDEHGAPC